MVLVVGERYGFITEHGLSATEDEFNHAQALGRPIFVFVQNAAQREPEQHAFIERVQGSWGEGAFTAFFDNPGQLGFAVEGAKAKNARRFAEYLIEGHAGDRPWITPPITLYHLNELKRVELAAGVRALVLPHGDFLASIDGETQRIAWGYAAHQQPALLQQRIPLVIHHGKQRSAMPGRASTISIRARSSRTRASPSPWTRWTPPTAITRAMIESSDVIRDRINLRRRQLRRKDDDVLTISALRTGIVTTILGEPGLQIGARPVGLPEGTELEHVEAAVVHVWSAVLDHLEEELDPTRRADVVVSAPAILAGIGVLAHHAVPQPPRREGVSSLSVDEVLERLNGVMWEREYEKPDGTKKSPWDGIAGEFTPAGRFSIGGPKEVGHAVAKALKDIASAEGQQIRGR